MSMVDRPDTSASHAPSDAALSQKAAKASDEMMEKGPLPTTLTFAFASRKKCLRAAAVERREFAVGPFAEVEVVTKSSWMAATHSRGSKRGVE